MKTECDFCLKKSVIKTTIKDPRSVGEFLENQKEYSSARGELFFQNATKKKLRWSIFYRAEEK